MLLLALATAVLADSALVRSGLSAILLGSRGHSVVAEAKPGDARSLPPDGLDLVVCDVPDGASGEALLDGIAPGVPVLALVGDPQRTRELVRAGAHGVVARGAPAERLLAASQAVASGLRTFDEQTLAHLLSPPREKPDGTLTPRERQVLELVAEGLSNKLIGGRLGISEHTVKFHIASIVDKLGADTRTDAVVRAARRGLLTL